MTTDIELVSRALADFDAVAAGLKDLAQRFEGVVFDVATTKGMTDAKAARMELRAPRFEVERIRKAAKAPILALGKKLDADAAKITAAIEKLEAPIDQQIKAEEDRKERERQAKIDAEVARVSAIHERVAELRGNQLLSTSSDPAVIAGHIGDLEKLPVTADLFAEFLAQATDAKAAGLARLTALHAAALARVAEEQRIVAERAELERLRAEQAERDRIERARIAEEQAAAKAALDAAAEIAAESLRKQRAVNEAVAAKAAEEQRQQLAAERAKADAERAEADRLAAVERQRQKAASDAEQARLAADRAELERQQTELRKAQRPATPKAERPSNDEIIAVVARHFGVSVQTAAEWIINIPRQELAA